MGRLKKTVRRAARAVKPLLKIALPLVFPAFGILGGGLPAFLGRRERGEEEPTEEKGGPPLPPREEEEEEQQELFENEE